MTGLKFNFDEEKTTEAATYLLDQLGGKTKYIKLIKLLYFADRLALREQARPITGDMYVSMDNGPVLSSLYDKISTPDEHSYWSKHIEKDGDYDIRIKEDPGVNKLSQMELECLNKIAEKWGDTSWEVLIKISHEFEEWTDPEGGALKIHPEDVFSALGFTEKEIQNIKMEVKEENEMEKMFMN